METNDFAATGRRLRGQLPKSIMQLGVLVQGQSFQSLGAQHVYSLSSWCVRVSIGLCVLSVEWIALPENV